MGTKKWSEIKKLSKATDADRAEARAELEEEILSYLPGRVTPSSVDHAGGRVETRTS